MSDKAQNQDWAFGNRYEKRSPEEIAERILMAMECARDNYELKAMNGPRCAARQNFAMHWRLASAGRGRTPRRFRAARVRKHAA